MMEEEQEMVYGYYNTVGNLEKNSGYSFELHATPKGIYSKDSEKQIIFDFSNEIRPFDQALLIYFAFADVDDRETIYRVVPIDGDYRWGDTGVVEGKQLRDSVGKVRRIWLANTPPPWYEDPNGHAGGGAQIG